ncbi:MAG TPA: FAD-dependent oxidoreductase [Gammaproteobacteria bacterium]|nr:FAD-dependent oxidoreductase [Gammaproteobacteria bacterium]
MQKKKLFVLFVLAALVCLFFFFDLQQYLTLDYARSQQARIQSLFTTSPVKTGLVYFCIYILVTGLSLPGAAILTLVGGAIFGLLWGTVIVSFASTIGASIAFLVARFLLHDTIQSRYARKLKTINAGIKKEGGYYLFTLRLIPIFPFFVINLVMGLTPIRFVTYFLVSQLGMLPGTIVYVNAGTQLAQVQNVGDILSANLLFAFALLGLFPLLAKWLVEAIKRRRVYRGFTKPDTFDRNMVVIGAGSAGLVCAYIAATVKAKVSLVEKHRMGGDCLNTGCVPSKALIRSARFLADTRRAESLGFKSASVDFDFADVMQRVQRVIKTIEPHDSVERYTELGVECLQGEATIVDPWRVSVNGKTLTTRNIVLATGAEPFIPPIDGLEQVNYYTSDTIWQCRVLPERLLVMGGGPIGCELAQCFAEFGSRVTLVEYADRLLIREDEEVADALSEHFRKELNIDLRLQHKATAARCENGRNLLLCETAGETVELEFDALLVAVGRRACTRIPGLDKLDIDLTEQGTFAVNDFLQTRYPNIYACGDAAGPYQFTHAAAHQAWYVSVNALFGRLKKFRVDYRVIPRATFTEPEIAAVGLNEIQARENGVEYEVTRYDLSDLDRAIADESASGLVKVLTVPGKDKILGVTIVGKHAGDLITEYIAAMKNNIGLNKILGTIHIYPTLAEANKYAAGNWKKAHTSEKLLNWLQRYHEWFRS